MDIIPKITIITFVCMALRFTQSIDVNLQTFSIRSSVHYVETNQNTDDKAGKDEFFGKYHEFYSAEQRRASILYETTRSGKGGKKSSGTYHLDKLMNVMLFENDDGKFSAPSKPEQVNDVLLFDLFDFELGSQVASHIVGPARLLFLIQKFKHKMVYIQILRLHNRPDIRYRVEDELDSWGKFEMEVFYRQEVKPSISTAFPYMVVISWLDKDIKDVSVEFSMLETLHPNGLKGLTLGQVAETDISMDWFMFHRARGCAEALQDRAMSLFAVEKEKELVTRFSLRAEVEYESSGSKREIFVAYDAGLESLRVDVSSNENKILSFKHKRLFHVRTKSMEDSNKDHPIDTSTKSDIDSECVVATIFAEEGSTVGRILTGGEKFTYLGEAQVRGIISKVYEVPLVNLPMWFESPLTETSPEQAHYTLVVYIDQSDDELIPLFIEIFNGQAGGKKANPFASINIKEFAWDLNVSSMNGDTGVQLFSLRSLCSGPSANHAQVEMMFESTSKSNAYWIRSAPLRNLAFLVSLQAVLDLPSATVHDLETKIVYHDGSISHFIASYRITEHMKSVKRLMELSRTNEPPGVATTPTRSFEDCFLMAAHMGASVVFSFQTSTGECGLDLGRPDATWRSEPTGATGIYWALSDSDTTYPKVIHRLLSRSDLANPTNVMGDNFQLIGSDVPGETFNLKLTKFVVERLKRAASGDQGYAAPIGRSRQPSKIVGFSLLDSDDRNTKVDSASFTSENSNYPHTMTFGRCKLLCMADLNCNSYSICIRNLQVECILSSVTFDFTLTLEQLNKLPKVSKIGSRIEITPSEGQSNVELEKYANCELFNKRYLDQFDEPTVVTFGHFTEALVPAREGPEGCAKRCAVQNINLIKKQSGRSSELNSLLISEIKNYEREGTVPRESASPIMRIRTQGCFKFHFIEVAKVPPKLLPKTSELLEGYCVYDNIHDHGQAGAQWQSIPAVKLFKFKFDTLYEEQYQISLAKSPKSYEEIKAYHALSANAPDALDHLSAFKAFLQRNENTKSIVAVPDKSACAALCLQQIHAPWPACKSFDVYLKSSRDSVSYFCGLNSITLLDAISKGKTELIETSTDSQMWHYEPILDFTFFDKDLFKRNTGDQTRIMANVTLFCTALIGFAIGVLVGAVASERVGRDRRESATGIMIGAVAEQPDEGAGNS